VVVVMVMMAVVMWFSHRVVPLMLVATEAAAQLLLEVCRVRLGTACFVPCSCLLPLQVLLKCSWKILNASESRSCRVVASFGYDRGSCFVLLFVLWRRCEGLG